MKKYTIEEIKAYARHWLKPSLNFDALSVGEPENERLLTFIEFIDRKDDRDNFDNFLKRRKSK